MKNKQAEKNFKSTLRVTRRLLSSVMCFAAVTLIDTSARAQNLFATEWTGGVIYEYTPEGVRITFASGLMGGPKGLVFDSAGNLFVEDWNAAGDGTIYKFTPEGVRSTFALGLSSSYPEGLAFDSAGNLFVSDDGGGAIYKFTPEGVRSTFASGLTGSLAFDSVGNLFVAGWSDDGWHPTGKIYKFTPDGVQSIFGSGFIIAGGLAFDSQGNLFLADVGDFVDGAGAALYKFTPDGVKHTIVSWTHDQIAPDGGVAVDNTDNVFVLAFDLTNGDTIYKFTPDGGRTIFAANGGFGSLAFQPEGGPPGFLGNISTRVRVQAGDNVTIGGFVITGTQPKNVIVRAIGPSISTFLPDALADPVLELRDSSGSLIRSNDNWRSDQEAQIIATGLPPSNDLESAIVATLPANGSTYTAIVRGVNSGTGIGLIEAYDLDQAVDSKLANISTRGLVQTGDNALIGGFIVLGQSPLRVIVRAIGPSLPLPGTLADPTLELYNSNGDLLGVNDNWRSDQEAQIMASGLAPSNDLESALLPTLTPGPYTAVVRGKNGTTGVALVEAYSLQ